MNAHHSDLATLVRLSEVISFAEFLSVETVTASNAEPVYPVTVGEKIVCYALDIILIHEWSSAEIELLVTPLENALQQLDTGVNQPSVWSDLFIANRALQECMK